MKTTLNQPKAKSTSTLAAAALIFALVPPLAFGDESGKTVPAPQAVANPYTSDTRSTFGGVKTILLLAAEIMPEEHYGFRPIDSVRTFGQIVGHIADSQYGFCSRVVGEKNPQLNIEKTKTSKADLTAALKDAFAYCDRAYGGLTDVTGAEVVKFMGDKPKLGVLNVNNIHTIEHYGNLVTYMRMKGFVPPTSDAEVMKQLSTKK